METVIDTNLGRIRGNDCGHYNEFLGIRYAKAGRFEYATLVDGWDGEYDATSFGASCPQSRGYYEHLDIPERLFYHNEFRDGLAFTYDEDCLNLNIYAPKDAKDCPVIVFFYGGGFNSGCTNEGAFDGAAFTKKGVILVTVSYRVGILGYLTHKDIFDKYGREGNFGLDDQFMSIKWVKAHIADFGGDPECITLMGQSAGAISIQYLVLTKKCEGLIKGAIMCSGAGLFPKFALPRVAEQTREYWLDFMNIAGVSTLDELKALDVLKLFDYIEVIKEKRKDNTYNTMPVVDGYLIEGPVDEIIASPLTLNYIIGYTNNDMYAPVMCQIGQKFGRDNNAFIYYFDIDAPGGKKNGAFHSSDIRYVFGTLEKSFRPYTPRDFEVSDMMVTYLSNFAKCGNPNGEGLPKWERAAGKALRIYDKGVKMSRPNKIKMAFNMLTKGEPT